MKKFSLTSLLLVMVMAFVTFFSSCDLFIPSSSSSEPAEDNKVTVTWYDGTEELKADKVEKGSKVTSWTPDVEGKTFMAWYSEASCTILFDFETVINEDTDIFAGFKGAFVEDTTDWRLIGGGAGTLKDSAWNESDPEQFKLTKLEEADRNVYQIENVTLYAGDEFQIRVKGTWDGQHGVGYVKGYTPVEGAEGEINGEVKDADGNLICHSKKGFGDSAKGWNIIMDVPGIYTITLETFPGSSDYDVITLTKTGEAAVIEKTHEMYLLGTVNGWADGLKALEDKSAFALKQDGKNWTLFYTITEEHYEDWTATDAANPLQTKCAAVKVINLINESWYGDTANDGANFFLTAGDYCIYYNEDANAVQIEKLEYYVVGTFLDGENAVNFSVKEGVTPKLELVEGVWTATFTATDVTGNGSYSWLKDQGKPGVFAIKVVYGCSLGIKDWYAAEGGDNFYLAAGEHTVTFDAATGTVTVA